MYDPERKLGILNDFDLASFISLGEASPKQEGYLRTGTKAFMALELLQDTAISGGVRRLYRHELESFAWVLLYAATLQTSQSGSKLFSQWHVYPYSRILEEKQACLTFRFSQLGDYLCTAFPHINPTLNTVRMWSELLNLAQPLQMSNEDVKNRSRLVFKEVKEKDCELLSKALKTWDLPEEDWVRVE